MAKAVTQPAAADPAALADALRNHAEAVALDNERSETGFKYGPGLDANPDDLDEVVAELAENDPEIHERSDTQLNVLRAELRRTQAMVERLMRSNTAGKAIELALGEQSAADRETIRRQIIDRIKEQGNGRVRITIFPHPDPLQNRPVYINANSTNGRYLPRGRAVEVSTTELEVLWHAESDTSVREVVDDKTIDVARHVQHYPFAIVDSYVAHLAELIE